MAELFSLVTRGSDVERESETRRVTIAYCVGNNDAPPLVSEQRAFASDLEI